MKWAYYNDHDKQKCAWVRELIKARVITDGEVDCRPIQEVMPGDLRGFSRLHFFAGIAAWDYALDQAGWPDDRLVWTGSCPCPGFSAAGKGQGFSDPRHLWPDWIRLIRECRPATIFGEQVDAAIGHGWLDVVQTDLEGASYAIGKAVLGAHSAGAPHIRQRLYFVADTASERTNRHAGKDAGSRSSFGIEFGGMREAGECADTVIPRLEGHFGNVPDWRGPGWLDPLSARSVAETGATRNFWADCDWWYGRDGKYRPIESSLQPLAHGASARVGRLRGYGDAICSPVAQAFIEAYMEVS